MQQKYQSELTRSKQKDTILEPRIPKEPTGRPLLLGNKIDAMVQKYIIASSNRGNVISRSIATSTAKALISRNPGYVGQIDLESSSWAQSLFRQMGFFRRRGTTAKLEIPDGAFKEVQLLFTHDIVYKVDKYNIPDSLIINIDQTPTKYVRVSRSTLAKKNSKAVAIKGSSDKRSITATFSMTFSGKFLPMQLIYGGKTTKSLHRFKFPNDFSLSVNKTHYSYEKETCKLIEESLVPYIEKVCQEENLPVSQKALVIMDVFSGQITSVVLDCFKDNKIEVVCVPENMTYLLQLLDLSVNGYAKKFTSRKFSEWYSSEIMKQLDDGKELHDINIDLKLSKLKPLHAEWLVELYNQMSTAEGQKIIHSAWKASGITEAMKAGKASLQPLDPFHDIDTVVKLDDEGADFNLREVCNLNESHLANGCSYNEDSDESSNESESEYVPADDFERNVFDAILDDEDDEL